MAEPCPHFLLPCHTERKVLFRGLTDGVHEVMVNYWQEQSIDNQERWEYLLSGGVIGEARAKAWADEVWGEEEKESHLRWPS